MSKNEFDTEEVKVIKVDNKLMIDDVLQTLPNKKEVLDFHKINALGYPIYYYYT